MNIQVSCKTDDSYEILINENLSEFVTKFEATFSNCSKILVITDSNVGPLYYESVKALLCDKYEVSEVVVPSGEQSKAIESAESIIEFLFKEQFSRKDVIIALGGGVCGDLAAFTASLYKRGIGFVNMPTTLLAMADSSVGGKTAVDYKGIKNIIGSFYMPDFVYMNLDFLKTLPEREFYAGFAEIMKAGLGFDSKFYMWLVENMYEICDKDSETLTTMLETSINIKKSIVEKDPFEEKGDRALLNLGHTIGHGIESCFLGEYLHGECVALGCVAAAFISWKKDMISMDDYYEVRDMFVPFNLPISISTDNLQPILDALKNDKKNTSGKVNMVLLKRIGKAVLVNDIEDELIVAALDELNFKDED